jgi:hypothetical protein
VEVGALGLVLLLVAQAGAPPADARPAPVRPGLSWEDADVVARTLRRIDRRLRSGRPAAERPVVVTERQLNSFLNLSLAERIPAEVSGRGGRLEGGGRTARATVDMDRLRARIPEGGASTLLSWFLLSGLVPVDIRARAEGTAGVGHVELEEVQVGGVSMPPSVLVQAVRYATRNAETPDGVDITAPVALPWTARSVRVEPGRLLVEFGRPPTPPPSTPR